MRAVMCAVLVVGIGCGRTDSTGPGAEPPSSASGSGAPTVPSQTEQKSDRLKPSVNAGALWIEFGANQAKADEAYTGRRITVGGDVRSVVKYGDGYAVEFMVGAPGFDADPRPGTIARFPPAETAKVAKLVAGQMCYLEGRCAGRIAGGRDGYSVIIDDALIVSKPNY